MAHPKDWADSYVAAFAAVAGLRVVTFDRGFSSQTQ
jgi:predicted nucleic acid-binding protein